MGKSKLKKILDYLIDFKTSRLLLSMKNNGYLVETGWLTSLKKRNPLNAKEEPIPWVTYSFIKFSESYLSQNHEIFEFGSGNSTLYYSKKVKSVYSVEHDLIWYNKLLTNKPDNVTLVYKNLDESYEESINESERTFDLIIIDGRRRINCIEKSIKYLKPFGLIVLDDSEREKYIPGINILTANGFKRIDFWGISPGYFQDKCTSIFFRKLGI
jgi:hypothetical protein